MMWRQGRRFMGVAEKEIWELGQWIVRRIIQNIYNITAKKS